jgi:hypothetical protein
LLDLRNDPNLLGMSTEELLNHPGISNSDFINLGKEIQKRRDSWEGTEMAKQAKASIDAELKIKPNTPRASLSDEQARAQTDAQQEFTTLMNNTPPEQRDTMAATNAHIAIRNVQKKEALEDVQSFTSAKQNTYTRHGPGSAEVWSKDKMDAYLKRMDTQISAASAKAKAP